MHCSIKFLPPFAGIVRKRAAPGASPGDDSSGDAHDLQHKGFKFMRIDKPEAGGEDLREGLAKRMLFAYTLRTLDKDGETIEDEHLDISLHHDLYYSVKRDLQQCQKRPATVSKETYYSVKRDLLQCQKRPTTVSKETYYSVKRDLLQCQKRPGEHTIGAGRQVASDCALRLHDKPVHEPADFVGKHEAQARRSRGARCLDQAGKQTRGAQLQGVCHCREEGIGKPW